MSKINIAAIVRDITTRTTYLTPLVEAVCNSIDAIGDSPNGNIDIIVKRETVLPGMGSNTKGEIKSIDIIDNGIGFNEENRESFDTYKSGLKYKTGGKGFGRFMYLKYFNEVSIESCFRDNDGVKCRKFRFGKQNNIIIDESVAPANDSHTGTILHLIGAKDGKISDKGIEIIARKLLEKLLVFFVNPESPAPRISITEEDKSDCVVLNDYIGPENDIVEIKSGSIEVASKRTGEIFDFIVQVYKIYHSPAVSRISLTANKREVTDTPIHSYIPEFKETLFEISDSGVQQNYSVKAYVLGDFLDDNVTVERDGFKIISEKLGDDDAEVFSDLTKEQIEKAAANLVRECFQEEMSQRFENKRNKVLDYVTTKAPWNRGLLSDIDLESMPMGISDSELEMRFQKAKFEKEQQIRIALKEIQERYDENESSYDDEEFDEEISELSENISSTAKNDLVHYVCLRKRILDLMDSFRRRRDDGSSYLEEKMHNVIFPKGKNTNQVDYYDHNLWILDERLVFTRFVASDQQNFRNSNDAPDIAAFFDRRELYRSGENQIISPVCIVEFKRPKRTDYSDSENPITQACRYARQVLEGKYELPDGLEPIKADKMNTPVYIYVVSDMVNKIRQFADEANLTLGPDGERYFGYMKAYNAYVEVMSYRSLIENAKMRNAVFFNKLGL